MKHVIYECYLTNSDSSPTAVNTTGDKKPQERLTTEDSKEEINKTWLLDEDPKGKKVDLLWKRKHRKPGWLWRYVMEETMSEPVTS